MPSFQVFRFLLSSAIMTADPFLGHDACLPPAFTCRSRRPRTYSRDHLFHIARLHSFSIFARFRRSFSSRCLGFNSGNRLGLILSIVAGVRTGSSMSSSRYLNGRSFSATSTSRTTFSSSLNERMPFPIDLRNARLNNPIRRSYCPPHQGARLRLNFHSIVRSVRK